jgi:phosphodiesterase/alkaline phosphatase D-like protein
MLMKSFVLTVAFMITAGLMAWAFADDAVMAAVPTHKAAQLTSGPELESATDTSAIIRWTTTNPGGAALHLGVVHYGTDAKNLTQVAQSPNRRSPSHPDMIFRVRILRLNSNTTYYYKVESTGATGASDGVSSSVKTFKTQ